MWQAELGHDDLASRIARVSGMTLHVHLTVITLRVRHNPHTLREFTLQ